MSAQSGSWTFSTIPQGWTVLDTGALRCVDQSGFSHNVIATEDDLSESTTLAQYIELQSVIIRRYLQNAEIEFHDSPAPNSMEECMLVSIRFQADDGRPAAQRQIYVRKNRRVGILTLTTLESDLSKLEPPFAAIFVNARFSPA